MQMKKYHRGSRKNPVAGRKSVTGRQLSGAMTMALVSMRIGLRRWKNEENSSKGEPKMKVIVKGDIVKTMPMHELKKGEYAVIVDTDIPTYTGTVVYCVYKGTNTVQYVGLTHKGMLVWNAGCTLLVQKVSAKDLQFVD